MARRYDAVAIAEKQVRRAGQAAADYATGIEGVQEAPTHKAARKLDKAREGYNRAIDSGKMADGLNAVSLEDWKRAALKKGRDRYASGVAASIDKVKDFHAQFGPFLETHMARIDAMPDTTEADREQKMIENMRGMKSFRMTKRRR